MKTSRSRRPTDANEAIDFIYKNSRPFAEAKATRIYMEEFRKSLKALLMAECVESAANAREQYAYSHPRYTQHIDGLRAAVEVEEALRWQLVAAQARVEVWRSEEASARTMDRVTA